MDSFLQKPDGPDFSVFLRTAERNPELLDRLLYLDSVRGTEDEKKRVRRNVTAPAEAWCDKFWDKSASAEDNAGRLGIKRIRLILPSEFPALPFRAFYDAVSGEIRIFTEETEKVLSAQEFSGCRYFSREALTERLIAHEVFHHLENRYGEITAAAVKCTAAENRIWRDIGANAFANAALGFPFSQLADLVWMMRYAPDSLSRRIEKTGIHAEE